MADELERMRQSLSGLMVKNTEQLVEFRSRFNRLRKSVKAETGEIQTRASALYSALAEKLAENQQYQKQQQKAAVGLFDALKKALADGQSHDALPVWDKIQGILNNTSGKIHSTLQQQAEQFQKQIQELRGWKTFAAAEKKKELLEQMQQLADIKMHPADLSRRINKIHQSWKELGQSSQNERLWKEFRKLSTTVSEPCKTYFAQRKQLMLENLARREELCERLEATLAKLAPGMADASKADTDAATDANDAVSVSAINPLKLSKLITSSEDEWKQYAPVPESSIKKIQKRFYETLNQIRELRSSKFKENQELKQALVHKAEALAELDDNQQAMDAAKKLQQEWQKTGPCSRRESEQLWKAFRAACDKVFAELNATRSAEREAAEQRAKEVGPMVDALEAMAVLDDEALREQRGELKNLSQRFAEISSPELRRTHRKQMGRFNTLQHQLEKRFRSLPDRKKLQLKQALQELAELIEKTEQALLKCKDEAGLDKEKESVAALREQVAASEPLLKDEHHRQALLDRVEQLAQAVTPAKLEAAVSAGEASLRELCIQVEIRADINSPEEDQALRMQLQLASLKKGLGQAKADNKENREFAFRSELDALCIGPLPSDKRKQLHERLEKAITKLR